VGGVSTHCQDRPFAVPEAEGLQPGVDSALGLGAGPGIAGGTGPAECESPIVVQVAPVRGHLLHLRLSGPNMRDLARRLEALAQGPGNGLNRPLVKVEVADLARCLVPVKEALRLEVGDGSVMLVQAGDQDALGGRAGGRGKNSAPAFVSIIAD